MSIVEFYIEFIAKQRGSRLFDALRRVGQMDPGELLAHEGPTDEEMLGWPEWPQAVRRVSA